MPCMPTVFIQQVLLRGYLKFFPSGGLCLIVLICHIAKVLGWRAFLVIFKPSLDSNLPTVAPCYGSCWLHSSREETFIQRNKAVFPAKPWRIVTINFSLLSKQTRIYVLCSKHSICSMLTKVNSTRTPGTICVKQIRFCS